MSFKVGIVGLPNVGKSTLFKALTKKPVDIANYPFCTIEPNVGVVEVPDERLDKLTEFSQSRKKVYTAIEFVDIAGLVKDAHKGEGLGNKFLSHIREVDAICEVVRSFDDDNITHVTGKVDPVSDIETINLELIYADISTVEKQLDTQAKNLKAGIKKEIEKKLRILEKLKQHLDQGKLISEMDLEDEERLEIRDLNLLTIKPIIYIYNVNEENINREFGKENIVTISAKVESQLAELSPEEAKEYLETLGAEKSGLEKLIQTAYSLLKLITFLTTGPDETRAWTVRNGAKAPEAAGKIHTDFEKGFIRAEVINWQELINAGSEVGAKEKGLIRIEGKEYLVKDGDVMVFRFAK